MKSERQEEIEKHCVKHHLSRWTCIMNINTGIILTCVHLGEKRKCRDGNIKCFPSSI